MPRVAPLDLRREDFPDLSGPRIEKLLRKLNEFGSQVGTVLNGGATFGDNSRAFVKEVTFSDADLPLRVKNTLSVTPKLVFLGFAADVTDGKEDPVSLYGPAWAVSGSDVVVSGFGNVSAGRKYRVRLVIAAG